MTIPAHHRAQQELLKYFEKSLNSLKHSVQIAYFVFTSSTPLGPRPKKNGKFTAKTSFVFVFVNRLDRPNRDDPKNFQSNPIL
jgi:hypothetical protein